MELYYREMGEGQTLIILHGLFGFSDNWVTLGKKLSENYHVILPDQRNHGLSPHSNVWNYDVMAEDLYELIEQKGLSKPWLVGHSMGGKTVMKYAFRYPDTFEKLVVVDMAPRYYPVHHQTIIEGLQSIDLAGLKSRGEADKQLATQLPDRAVRQFLLKNLSRKPDGYHWKANLSVISQQIENVGEAIESDQPLQKPVFFMGGERSDYITEADHADIHRLFPQARIKTIPGAGHWIHAEKPQEFLTELLQFLES